MRSEILNEIEKATAFKANESAAARKIRQGHVSLKSMGITDQEIPEIINAIEGTAVTSLTLRGNQISDRGVEELVKCKQLTSLGLSNNFITDDGLKLLADAPHVTSVDISHNKHTLSGSTELEQAFSAKRRQSNCQSKGL